MDICAVALNRKEENGNTDFEYQPFPVKFGVRERRSTAAVQTLREIWRAFGSRGAFGLRRLQRRFRRAMLPGVKTNGRHLKCNPFSKLPNWNLEASDGNCNGVLRFSFQKSKVLHGTSCAAIWS
jgi:hypothetical protein